MARYSDWEAEARAAYELNNWQGRGKTVGAVRHLAWAIWMGKHQQVIRLIEAYFAARNASSTGELLQRQIKRLEEKLKEAKKQVTDLQGKLNLANERIDKLWAEKIWQE